MSGIDWITPLRRDGFGVSLSGGSRIARILNISVNTGWTTIRVPSGVSCKSLVAKLRASNSWKLRQEETLTYISITGALSLDLVLQETEVLGEVQATQNDVLEVLMIE
jgi:hypothetical protein